MSATSPTSERNWLGERLLLMRLGSLRKANYTRYSDIIIPAADGAMAADQVIVSKFGVFVIEMKTMRGQVSGGENDPMWTLKAYRRSFPFENPVRQGARRTRRLAEYLGLPHDNFHALVIFSGGKFKTEMPANVFPGNGFIEYIRSFHEEVLSPSDVERINGELQELKKHPALVLARDLTPAPTPERIEPEAPVHPTLAAERKLRDDMRASLRMQPIPVEEPRETNSGGLALKLAGLTIFVVFMLILGLLILSFFIDLPRTVPAVITPPPLASQPAKPASPLVVPDMTTAPAPAPALTLDPSALEPATPTPTPGITAKRIPDDEPAAPGKVRAFSATVDGQDVRDADRPLPPPRK